MSHDVFDGVFICCLLGGYLRFVGIYLRFVGI